MKDIYPFDNIKYRNRKKNCENSNTHTNKNMSELSSVTWKKWMEP